MFKMTATLLLLALACGASALRAVAQSVTPPPCPDYPSGYNRVDDPQPGRDGVGDDLRCKEERQGAQRDAQKRAVEFNRVAATEFDRGRESRPERERRMKFELNKGIGFHPLSGEDKARLAPPAEDAAQFASFLSQPGTGLVRLLPRDEVNFNGRLSVRGGGAYYSFAHLVHEYNYGSDIGLQRGGFATGFAGASYGLLLDLGDVPLENVLAESEPAASLASFVPPSAEAEARKIQTQLHADYRIGGAVYRNRGVPAVVGHTYLLRSVDYRMSDVLVAFRVISKDEEKGDVVLLWKMLKRFNTPQLAPSTPVHARGASGAKEQQAKEDGKTREHY